MCWVPLLSPFLGASMVMLDATILDVALPSIQRDLGLSTGSLVWIVNGYMVFFSGSLLLAGRLGDCYGHRRIFAVAMGLFMVASLVCGIAAGRGLLLAGRAFQGSAAAAIVTASLSATTRQFEDVSARAQALSIWSLVCSGGGGAGVLLGGIVTSTLGWHGIFLINLPVGAIVCALWLFVPFRESTAQHAVRLDIAGATLITTSITLAMFAAISLTQITRPHAVTALCGALLCFALFVWTESRVDMPVVPLSIFRYRDLALISVLYALWGAAQTIWAFMVSLFLQFALGYTALETGLALLPSTLMTAVLTAGLSRHLVARFGGKAPLNVALLLVTWALVLLSRAPASGATYVADVLPSMLLIGGAFGIGHGPLLFIAMNGVSEEDHGVASGILTSASMIGGSVALAAVVGLLIAGNRQLVSSGPGSPAILIPGYHAAFAIAAAFAASAWLASTVFVRGGRQAPQRAVLR